MGTFYPSIVRDGLNVHLVCFTTGTAGTLMYLRSGSGGDSWAPAVSLVSGSRPSQPFIAARGDATHLIWKDMRGGHGAIYYKRNPTGNK